MPSNPQRDAKLVRLQEKEAKLQSERRALGLRMKELGRQIAEVKAEYGAVYNEPAPLLTLSTEVTCLIFDFTVAAELTSTRNALADDQDERKFLPEIVVSQVCHQWRAISLAYPALWTRFCYDGPQALRFPLDRLDAYLERSASQPLELWFNFRVSEDRDWTWEGQLALLQRSIPAIARWKCFTILSDSTTPVDGLLFEIASLSAQNLEHFVFCPSVDLDTDISSSLSVFKNSTPKLKSLTLDCSYRWLLPLSNIITLHLEAPFGGYGMVFSWATFSDILSISSLENLSLVGSVVEIQYHQFHVELINMKSLKNLRCGKLTPFWLPFLRAPLLTTLTIRQCCMNPGNHERLKSEPYAFPALRSLCLVKTSSWDFHMAHYLAQMTGLVTDFVFSQENGSCSFSSMILNGAQSETYWTKAVHITVNYGIVDFPQIVRFVQARRMNKITLCIIEPAGIYGDRLYLQPEECKELSKICTLEKLSDKTIDNTVWKKHWQFGGYCSGCPEDDSEDLFRE